MNQFVFKSRWIAIAFTALALLCAYSFASYEKTTVQAESTPNVQPKPVSAPILPQPQVQNASFMDDAVPVNDAAGFDPSPPSATPTQSASAHNETPQNGNSQDTSTDVEPGNQAGVAPSSGQ